MILSASLRKPFFEIYFRVNEQDSARAIAVTRTTRTVH